MLPLKKKQISRKDPEALSLPQDSRTFPAVNIEYLARLCPTL